MSTMKSFIERLENLDVEQKGIGTDKREVFDEAAAAGYDKKAIRRLLRDRREATKDKGTAELAEQYRMLLSEPGATYRSVADKTGAKRSTLHRLVPKNKNGTEQIDEETGEVNEGNSAHEGEENGQLHSGDGGVGRDEHQGVPSASDRRDGDANGEPVGHHGRQSAAASECDRRDRGTAGSLHVGPAVDPRQQGGRTCAGAAARHAGLAALHGGDDGSRTESAGDARQPIAGPDLANTNAAPEACADGPSVFRPTETIVPRLCTPQADEVGALSVKPVPDEGVGDWQPNEIGAVAEPSSASRVASDPWSSVGDMPSRLRRSV